MKHQAWFHPLAQQELQESAEWYDKQRLGLGDEFVDAVVSRVSDICRDPRRFPFAHAGVRQALLSRFPFAIYYRHDPDRVSVLSVFHASRDPASLIARLPRD
jgi:plasmid stabilization system protein ParE